MTPTKRAKGSKARRRLEQRRPFRRRMLEVINRSDAGEISEATSMQMISAIVHEMHTAAAERASVPPVSFCNK